MNSEPKVELPDVIRALEPPYQSQGEARIGRVLDAYGVPFWYRQPMLIYDQGLHQIWHPDFTLPTYNGLVIEYAGMKGVPSQAPLIAQRQQTYAANAVPAVFMYPEDLAAPDWPDELTRRIEQAAYQSMGSYGPAQRGQYQ